MLHMLIYYLFVTFADSFVRTERKFSEIIFFLTECDRFSVLLKKCFRPNFRNLLRNMINHLQNNGLKFTLNTIIFNR